MRVSLSLLCVIRFLLFANSLVLLGVSQFLLRVNRLLLFVNSLVVSNVRLCEQKG